MKLCLVEAGKFVLGIDVDAIHMTLNADCLCVGKLEAEISLIHLESFLSRQPLVVPLSDMFILKVKNGAKQMALLVDRVTEKIIVPEQSEPLPLLYPDLAQQCCPQVIVHGNQTVLVLDVQGLVSVLEQLASDHGLLTPTELVKMLEVEKNRAKKHPEYAVKFSGDGLEEKTLQATNPVKVDLRQESECAEKSAETEHDVTAVQAVEENNNNDPVSTIIQWAVKEYRIRAAKGNVTISIADMPFVLRRNQELSDDKLHYLLRQVVKRCESTDDDILLRLSSRG